MATTETTLITALDANDPDGTQLDEEYVWLVNGASIEGETGATLDAQHFVKGDTVSVEVTVSDGASTAVQSASTLILNSAPQPTAQAESLVKTGSAVTLYGSASDADEDEVSYEWNQVSGDSVELSNTATAESGFIAPDEAGELIFSLTATDEEDQSEPVTVTVKVENAPRVDGLSLLPEMAYTDTPLAAILEASDADGDELTLSYSWRVNGELLDEQSADTLDSSHYVKGDTVEVTATVFDGNWEATGSAEITIDNRKPEVSASSEGSVQTNRAVTLKGSATDLDGDALTYKWVQISGEPVTLSDSTAADPTFNSPYVFGNLVFALTASDGESTSDRMEVTVEVVNSPPVLSSLTLTDLPAYTNTDLRAVVEASDVDGQALTNHYQWFVNGEEIESLDSATLPSTHFSKDDQVMVTVIVSDGELMVSKSEDTVIQNSPLEITVLNMPETAAYGEAANFQVLIEDADNDPYTWNFLARPNGMVRDESGAVTWTPTGPMFDTQMDAYWEISVQQDEEQHPVSGAITIVDSDRQWPLSGGISSPSPRVTADLDGDGKPESMISHTRNRLYATAFDGTGYGITWAYPFAFTEKNLRITSAVAANLDDDSADEILVGLDAYTSQTQKTTNLYMFDGDQKARQVATVEGHKVVAIRTADLDNDGQLEIVVLVDMLGSYNSSEQCLTILKASDFSLVWQSPSLPLGVNLDTGNVDEDPTLEIATDNGYLFGLNGEGYELEWHYSRGFNEQSYDHDIEIADVDGDGIGEIIGALKNPEIGSSHYLTLFDAVAQGVKVQNPVYTTNIFAFDTDGDGKSEILTTENGVGRGQLYSFDAEASPQLVPHWNSSRSSAWGEGMAIVNLDDDPELEFFFRDRGHAKTYSDMSGDGNVELEWTTPQPNYLTSKLSNLHTVNFNGEGVKLAAMGQVDFGSEAFYLGLMNPGNGEMTWEAGIPRLHRSSAFSGGITDLGGDGTSQLLYAEDSVPRIYDFFSESFVWTGSELDGKVVAVAHAKLASTSNTAMVLTTELGSVYAFDSETFQQLWHLENAGGIGLEVVDFDGTNATELVSYTPQSLNLITPGEGSASITRTFSLNDIPEAKRSEYFGLYFDRLNMVGVTTGDVDGDSNNEIVLALTNGSAGDTWLLLLNSDFTLRSVASFPDIEILSMQMQDYGDSANNIMLNVQFGGEYYDHFFIEADPSSGKIISESPKLSDTSTPGSMKLVDTNGDGIRELFWTTVQGAINITR